MLTFANKVAIVRQRETAALKKAMKASSSRGSSTSCGNTFDRDVVGVFSVGTSTKKNKDTTKQHLFINMLIIRIRDDD
jgi:hypothetical protein